MHKRSEGYYMEVKTQKHIILPKEKKSEPQEAYRNFFEYVHPR